MMDDSGEIRKRVLAVKEVGVLPQIAVEIEEAAQDELGSILNIEELVRSDISLSAMVLKMANSAYYGRPGSVASVGAAVAALGLEEVTLLALGVGTLDPLEAGPGDRGFDLVEFWVHSFSVSWLAAKLALTSGQGDPAEAASAALLHDLGKLVILTRLKPEGELLRRYLLEGRDYYQAEFLAGLDHATIGYWLARKWGLPEGITRPIRDHHRVDPENGISPATALVILANGLAKSLGFGLVHQEREAPIRAALAAVNLTASELKPLARKAEEELPPIVGRWRRLLSQGEG